MQTLYDVGTKDVHTCRLLVAVLIDPTSMEGSLLERVCGYRSIFYVLLKVASPHFSPATRKLAAQTIRKMRAHLLVDRSVVAPPPPLAVGTGAAAVHAAATTTADVAITAAAAAGATTTTTTTTEATTTTNLITPAAASAPAGPAVSVLPLDYNVREVLNAVAGPHAVVRLAIDFCNAACDLDPAEIIRMDGLVVLVRVVFL